MKRVVVIQRILPHYRISFVEGLTARLANEAVELHLIYGQERPGEVPVSVPLSAPWATHVRNRYFSIGPASLTWQPCVSLLRGADLLIVEQANSLLLNHALQARLVGRGVPTAYWGHGRNRQAAGWRLAGEKIKMRLSKRVDWWFAYTDGCRLDLLDSGYPAERITVVNNAVDTGGMVPGFDDSSSENLTGNACIYCGGMYPAKRLDFLLEAAVHIRQQLPDFELVLIGSGPTAHLATAAAERYGWIHYLGPLTGVARTEWFRRCRAQLMPGLVGLTIVDSFAAATPLITTDTPTHSPEIDYLVPGFNGLMSTNSIEDYTHTVVAFLRSAEMQRQLVEGCRVSAATYTIENMIERFTAGVLQSLAAGAR
jgi:L-malate glycosyltransferase